MEQTLSPEIEELLQDLQAEQAFSAARIAAARKLGRLSVSNLPVVNALIAALESDPSPVVRKEAATSLRAPAHQEILQQHPDLMHKVLELQAALQDQSVTPQATNSGQSPAQKPVYRPTSQSQARIDPAKQTAGGTRGLGNIVVGIVFIIGGLSGNLVLRGTNSGELLALVGLGLVVWVWGVLKRTNQV